MPIDIACETLIPLSQATAHLPRRRKGRKPSVATLYRWAGGGLHGVVLETLQVGGTKCTTLGAMQRFFNSLSVLSAPISADRVMTTEIRQRAEEAERETEKRWRRPRQCHRSRHSKRLPAVPSKRSVGEP
jgi:hypothetical protein